MAHEAVYTVLAALRSQFETEISAHTSPNARAAANAYRKKSNASTEPPSISLGARQHLTMSIPVPRAGRKKSDGAAAKIEPPPATKPRPPPLVSDLPMQCELNVAFRNRVWLDIMRSGSVVLLWPLDGHPSRTGKQKHASNKSCLPVLLAQTYAGGVREYILNKKKMVGLTFLVCSCGHNVARDFPGTKWAVTPVTSLLSLDRMFKVVASSPKKLPFSHLLLGRPTAAHTVFSDSDDDTGGDCEDEVCERRTVPAKGGDYKAAKKDDVVVVDLITEICEKPVVDSMSLEEVCRRDELDSSDDEEGEAGTQEAAAAEMLRKKALAELSPDSSDDEIDAGSDDDGNNNDSDVKKETSPAMPLMTTNIGSPFEVSLCSMLNPSQRKAIDMCIGLSKSSSPPSPLVLLQGPPGTGKTTTIVRLLQVLRNRGLRVAVCASTNKAVSVVMSGFMNEAVKTGPTGGPCTPHGPNAYLVGVEDQVEPQLRGFFIHDQPDLLRASLEWCEREAVLLLEWFTQSAERRPKGSVHVMHEYPGVGDILDKIESWMSTAEIVVGFESNDFYFHAPVIYAIRENWDSFRADQASIQEAMQFLRNSTADKRNQKTKISAKGDTKIKGDGVVHSLAELQRGHLKYLAESIAHHRQFLNDHMDDRNIEMALLNQAQFVFCTLCIAGRSSLSPRNMYRGFDVLIVDEAAQPIEAELLIATTLRPKQLVLVGDPCQLSAAVESQEARRAGFGSSLMTRLVKIALEKKSTVFHMLDTQYRMDPVISKWPSDTFYGSKLKDGDCVSLLAEQRKDHFLTDMLGALSFIDCEAGREERARRGGSLYNKTEADVVAHIVSLLTDMDNGHCDSHGLSIRVLTFYRAQVAEISQRIERMQRQMASSRFFSSCHVRVDTVDSMQGSEADIIILSFVRTSRNCGFLDDARRLNVALTRAKRSLILVGRRSTLEQSDASHIVSCMESIRERDLFRTLPPAAPQIAGMNTNHHHRRHQTRHQREHQHQQYQQHQHQSQDHHHHHHQRHHRPQRQRQHQHQHKYQPQQRHQGQNQRQHPHSHQHRYDPNAQKAGVGQTAQLNLILPNRQENQMRAHQPLPQGSDAPRDNAITSSVPIWGASEYRQVDTQQVSRARALPEGAPTRLVEDESWVRPRLKKEPTLARPRHSGGDDIFRSRNTHALEDDQQHLSSKQKLNPDGRLDNPGDHRTWEKQGQFWMGEISDMLRHKHESKKKKRRRGNNHSHSRNRKKSRGKRNSGGGHGSQRRSRN